MGPLKGLRIVEMAGIGPGPFCGMLLSDLGADVVRVDRPGGTNILGIDYDVLLRGRRTVEVDLKSPDGVALVLDLVDRADALFEGFRPGVMERLGLGPDVCRARNKRLVYGRMTGWGQEGPLAHAAGHDINYVALTGALSTMGSAEQPIPPINLLGDFAGGSMYLAVGLLSALLEAKTSGEGQVVDAAITDGTAHLMAMVYNLRHFGYWTDRRQDNMLDTGAHFYGTYECADGKWISIGSIEPQFYALLREKAGLADAKFNAQMDRTSWAPLKQDLVEVFREKAREEWCALMEGTDVCFAPVLTMDEAPAHPHNAIRETFVRRDDVVQPAPAPRFSRTEAELSHGPNEGRVGIDDVLGSWGAR